MCFSTRFQVSLRLTHILVGRKVRENFLSVKIEMKFVVQRLCQTFPNIFQDIANMARPVCASVFRAFRFLPQYINLVIRKKSSDSKKIKKLHGWTGIDLKTDKLKKKKRKLVDEAFYNL